MPSLTTNPVRGISRKGVVISIFPGTPESITKAGCTLNDVVKVTVFFTDMANLQTYFEVRDRYVNTKAPPASTAVQISKLARSGSRCLAG